MFVKFMYANRFFNISYEINPFFFLHFNVTSIIYFFEKFLVMLFNYLRFSIILNFFFYIVMRIIYGCIYFGSFMIKQKNKISIIIQY